LGYRWLRLAGKPVGLKNRRQAIISSKPVMFQVLNAAVGEVLLRFCAHRIVVGAESVIFFSPPQESFTTMVSPMSAAAGKSSLIPYFGVSYW